MKKGVKKFIPILVHVGLSMFQANNYSYSHNESIKISQIENVNCQIENVNNNKKLNKEMEVNMKVKKIIIVTKEKHVTIKKSNSSVRHQL